MLTNHPVSHSEGFRRWREWTLGTHRYGWIVDDTLRTVVKRYGERSGRRGSQAGLQNIDFVGQGSHKQAPRGCHDQNYTCQSEVSRPEAASPGILLETRILSPYLKIYYIGNSGVGSNDGILTSPQVILMQLKSADLYSELIPAMVCHGQNCAKIPTNSIPGQPHIIVVISSFLL